MSIEKVINLYQDYHWESELRAMNRIADGIHDGVIVAIGSYRGQSDCALALHAHVPVYCIDPRVAPGTHYGDVDRPYWMRNVLDIGVAEKVRPIELPSLQVAKFWTHPIGLLFIDGDHDQAGEDLNAWLPHVVDGGLIAFHDNNHPAVIAAVTQSRLLVEIERTNLTTIYRREDLYEVCSYEGINFFVRKGPYNKDDKYVLAEVRGYDIGTDPVRTCIDVGGHIGAFSAWIQHAWPGSHTVAVEPEYSSSKLLVENVAGPNRGNGEVTPFLGIVSYSLEAQMLIVDPVNSGCHKTIDVGDMKGGQSAIPVRDSITLEEIMEDKGWDSLDLLKVDAEGAEVDIFAHCSDEFLRDTRRVVGEFHFGVARFWDTVGTRLRALGFEVTAETNPIAHSTFLAINKNWTEPESPIEPVVTKKKAGRPKKS